MIEVKNLTKKYGTFTAVKDLNFTIEKGRIYGLLGPNGAGKSTTMNIMTGCLAATEGSVTVNGYDIYENASAAKKSIGYLPEIPPLYTDMTPREYLKFVGRAKKISRDRIEDEIKRVSKLCGIDGVSDRLIKNLSKGYRQRVGIAQALIGDPEVIILDEPTVGLDPIQLIEIRNLIRSLKNDHAVILSSHIMGEITAVCDYIIIMAYGRIVAEGTQAELEGASSEKLFVEAKVKLSDSGEIRRAVSSVPGVVSCEAAGSGENCRFTVGTAKGADVREKLFNTFSSLNVPILEMTKEHFSLESLFVRLTSSPAPAVGDETVSEKKAPSAAKKKYAFKLSTGDSPYLDDKKDSRSEEKNKKGSYKPHFDDGEEAKK